MNDHKQLEVWMDQRRVGTLAETENHLVAFEYCDEWIRCFLQALFAKNAKIFAKVASSF